MRRALISLLVASLALPAAANAQATFEYSGPAASVKRGAAVTFKVKTSAAATIRISGTPTTDATGLLSGARGMWVDEKPKAAAADGVLTWTAPRSFLVRTRPGTYWWQAYAGDSVGAVQKLTVTLPSADRGRGALYPRYGKRGHASFYLSSANWPAGLDGLRFQSIAKTAAARWGLHALTWTSLKAGRRDGFDVVGFAKKMPTGDIGLETDYAKHGRVVEQDLTLRASANWNAGPGYPALDQVDLQSVLLHELGHMAGVKKHQKRCTDSPMIESLGTGEWWRGPKDYFFANCTAQASSLSAGGGLFIRRVVNVR
jgi:hypothetical protein